MSDRHQGLGHSELASKPLRNFQIARCGKVKPWPETWRFVKVELPLKLLRFTLRFGQLVPQKSCWFGPRTWRGNNPKPAAAAGSYRHLSGTQSERIGIARELEKTRLWKRGRERGKSWMALGLAAQSCIGWRSRGGEQEADGRLCHPLLVRGPWKLGHGITHELLLKFIDILPSLTIFNRTKQTWQLF